MLRAFFHIRTVEVPGSMFGSTPTSLITLAALNDPRWGQLEEVQQFFVTAANGDVFQLQNDECIVALGNLVTASWLKR
jgi:hypothetical protein